MSLRKVYGKRTRRVYDPLPVFESPPQQTIADPTDIKSGRSNNKASAAKLQRSQPAREKSIKRDALGELSVNETVQDRLPRKGDPRRRKAKKEIAVEDGHENANAREAGNRLVDAANDREHEAWNSHTSKLEAIDEMPLFCDVEGYGSEAEAEHEEERTRLQNKKETIIYDSEWQRDAPEALEDDILVPITPENDGYSRHCSEILSLSSRGMTIFSEWSEVLSTHFNITKIAEASFSEVYRMSLLEQIPGFSSNDESVFKIIPLRPPEHTLPIDKRKRQAAMKKIAMMSTPEDVANEVKLLQRMSSIPGFTNFRDVRVVKGRPPQPFVQAFKLWNTRQKARKKEPSNFPDPAKKTSYADDQLWAVIEMQDAGMDLEQLVETGNCDSIWFIWDVFWQVVLSLAKGEEGAEFEHRDLHLGNICVRSPPTDEEPVLDPTRKLNFTGQETTIIDYTISRALLSDGAIAYHDLAADPGLFEGDSTEEYQYDIYRFMRGTVLFDDPYIAFSTVALNSERNWQQYFPITNLIWLHFILYKLLEQVEWPSATKAPSRKLKELYKKWKRANELEKVLLRLQELLDPAALCQSDELKAAADLVGLALREGWLDVEDVVGAQGDDSALVEQFESLQIGDVGEGEAKKTSVECEKAGQRRQRI